MPRFADNRVPGGVKTGGTEESPLTTEKHTAGPSKQDAAKEAAQRARPGVPDGLQDGAPSLSLPTPGHLLSPGRHTLPTPRAACDTWQERLDPCLWDNASTPVYARPPSQVHHSSAGALGFTLQSRLSPKSFREQGDDRSGYFLLKQGAVQPQSGHRVGNTPKLQAQDPSLL